MAKTLPLIVRPEDLSAGALAALRLIDARHGPDRVARYEAAHLRGAVRVDLESDLSAHPEDPRDGGRHPLPALRDFAALLGRLGITPDTDVLVYDEGNGALAAARFVWMLRAVGHAAVSLLDGGLAAAGAAGLPIDSAPARVDPAPPYPVPAAFLAPRVDRHEVERRRLDPAWRLLDVRAPDRYRGDTELFDPVAGHIAGARSLPLTASLDASGRFLAQHVLREHFTRALEGTPPERVIVSCGSGVTACHTLLALEHAGLPGAHLYVGSWSEWCRGGRALASGQEPGA